VCVWELIDSNKLGIYIYFGPLFFFPPFLTSAALTQTHIYFSLSLSRVVFYSFFCGGYNTYSGMQIVGCWLTAARLDWWVRGPWKDKGFSDGHIVVARKILMALLSGERERERAGERKERKGNHCGIKRNIGLGNSAISCTK
jgi:hypothetical protein